MKNGTQYPSLAEVREKTKKPNVKEYFLSEHLHRKISTIITYFLLRTSISPNLVTSINFIISSLASILFLFPLTTTWFLGILLYQISHIVDGVDGEIARFKHQESKKGALLDDIRHNFANSFLLLCLGIGLFEIYGKTYLIILGAVGSIFVLLNDILNKILPPLQSLNSLILKFKFQQKQNKFLEFVRGLFTFGVLGYVLLVALVLDILTPFHFMAPFSWRIFVLLAVVAWELILFFNKIKIFFRLNENDFSN